MWYLASVIGNSILGCCFFCFLGEQSQIKVKWKKARRCANVNIQIKQLFHPVDAAFKLLSNNRTFSFFSLEIYHCPHYLNYYLMIHRAACSYVHTGTALPQKKQSSVVHSTNYKGVKWFINAALQIKKNIPSSSRTRSAYLSMQTSPRHFEIRFLQQFHDA